MPDHPLSDIFSDEDLERLRDGRCVESGGVADADVAGMVAEDFDLPDGYCVSLGQWFRQAAQHGDEVRRDYRRRLRHEVADRNAFLQVSGELMAAYFLEVQLGFGLRHVPRQGVPTPEFEVHRDGLTLVVEVKTVMGGLPFRERRSPGLATNPAPAVRKAMRRARRQLGRGHSNLVLIVDEYMPAIRPVRALDAVYGDSEIAVHVSPEGLVSAGQFVRKKNVFCRWDKNVRIGAVGFLHWHDGAECVGYFIHNRYAKDRIPPSALDPWPQWVLDEAKGGMVWRNPRQGW